MENKHTAEDLKVMQSYDLDTKIALTKARIRGWHTFWSGQVYVSISGGKDSQVLAHLVKSMYPDVPLVFVNTGLEYDSVRLKGTEMADTVLTPKMSFVEVIKKYGYPIISKEVSQSVDEGKKYIKALQEKECPRSIDRQTDRQTSLPYAYRIADFYGVERRQNKSNPLYVELKQGNIPSAKLRTCQILGIQGDYSYGKMYDKSKYNFLLFAPFRISNKCCDVMKKSSANKYEKQTDRKPFIGTMAAESRLRKSKWIKYGCNAFDQKDHPTSQPLSFWTEQDIYQYIKRYELEIANVYGDIVYQDNDGMYYDNNIFNESMELTTTGVKRTGCVFCMFGITQDTDRFLKLKELEPKKYEYIMRGGKFDEDGMWIPYQGLGYKFVIDWLNEHGNLGIRY